MIIQPNNEDIENYSFNDINILTNLMTINNETFKLIDKLYNNFEIKQYK